MKWKIESGRYHKNDLLFKIIETDNKVPSMKELDIARRIEALVRFLDKHWKEWSTFT